MYKHLQSAITGYENNMQYLKELRKSEKDPKAALKIALQQKSKSLHNRYS